MSSPTICPKGTGIDVSAPSNWTTADCKVCQQLTYNDGSFARCQPCSDYVDVGHTSCTAECPNGQSAFFPGAHTCVCNAGREEQNGVCVPCNHGSVAQKTEKCNVCPNGQFAAPDQRTCITSATCSRAGGSIVNDLACVCTEGRVYKNNKCQCAQGYREEDGQCIECRSGTVSIDGLNCIACSTQEQPNTISSLDKKQCIEAQQCLSQPLTRITDDGQCECQEGAIKSVVDGQTRCMCPGNQYFTPVQELNSKAQKSSQKLPKAKKAASNYINKVLKDKIKQHKATIQDVCNPCSNGIQSIDGYSCFDEFACINAGNTKIEDGRCQCIEGGVAENNQCSCPNDKPYISVDRQACVETCREGAVPVVDPVTNDTVCTCNGGITGLDGNSCTSAYECDQMRFTEIVDGKCVCDPEVSQLNTRDNTCECKDDTYLGLDQQNCVQTCPKGTSAVTQGKYCQCNTGTVVNPAKDRCIDQQLCTGLAQINQTNGQCICTGGSSPEENGVCKCPVYIGLDQTQCVTQCSTNERVVNGKCVCIDGYGITNNQCVRCNSGSAPSVNGECQQCSNGTVSDFNNAYCIQESACNAIQNAEIVNNQCICGNGTQYINGTCTTCNDFLTPDGDCVAQCPENSTADGQNCVCNDGLGFYDGQCVQCPIGMVVDNNTKACINCGSGEIASVPQDECIITSQCSNEAGMTPDTTNPQCVCFEGATYNETTGTCQCDQGTYYALVETSCVQDCGGNTTVTDSGCKCIDGYVIALNDQFCIQDADCTNLDGQVNSGSCECPDGFKLNNDRTRCVVDSYCEDLEELSNNQCICVDNAERVFSVNQTSGTCRCKNGYFHNVSGNSCEQCESGQAVGLDGQSCIQKDECNGSLTKIDSTGGYDRCVCITNATYTLNGTCACSNGTGLSLDGKSCGDCQVNTLNVNNECQCIQNFTLYNTTKDIFCVPTTCDAGHALNGTDGAISHLSVSIAKKTTNASQFCSPCKDGWAQDGMSSQGVQCNQTGLISDLLHEHCVSELDCGNNTRVDKSQCMCDKGFSLSDSECVKSKASVGAIIAIVSLITVILLAVVISGNIIKSRAGQKQRKTSNSPMLVSEAASTLNNTAE